MIKRFKINWVVEHGHPHYRIVDFISGREIHCDEGELTETIQELMEVA